MLHPETILSSMTPRRVLIASDVHAGATPVRQLDAFLSWLGHARRTAGWIILNGDLFDFWCEYRRGHSLGYDRLLSELGETARGDRRVTLVAGNHDWWGGDHLEREVGIEYVKGPLLDDLCGWRVFVAHGDRCGRGDLAYRVVAPLLRSGPVPRAFRLLSPEVGDRLAGLVSRTSAHGGEPSRPELARAKALREWGLAKLASDSGLDAVVLGHSHVPEFVSGAAGGWYINSGDWVYHRSYVVFGEREKPTLRRWTGTAV